MMNLEGKSEHSFSLNMVGDEEALRSSLSRAVEQFGYTVTSDLPLIARRNARRWGRWGLSWDPFEYAAKLTITLRRQRQNLFSVTFDYEINDPYLMRSDRKLLEKEAEAIAALAAQGSFELLCPSCHTVATDDSRFCRRCGAALKLLTAPAEVDLVRAMGRARSAFRQSAVSLVMMLGFLCMLLAFFTTGNLKILTIGFWMSSIGLLFLVSSFWSNYRTLKLTEGAQRSTLLCLRGEQAPLLAPPPAIISASQPYASVTEQTTELLDGAPRETDPLR